MGTYTTTPAKEYVGSFTGAGAGLTGELVKGGCRNLSGQSAEPFDSLTVLSPLGGPG